MRYRALVFVCSECGERSEVGGPCGRDGQPRVRTSDPLLGTDIGRYRVTRLLGEGGMGRVYLAIQPAIGSRVAIKLLGEEAARRPDLVERFFAEARAVNLIRHEHIAAVLDLDRLPDGRPYIVMEYVEGPTLAKLVRGVHAPIGGVVQVIREVLAALQLAHEHGIVHRDLKPDNVLVTAEGHAKVLDFGIAKLAPALADTNSPRTADGALLGTPAYMAPEQIQGGVVDARTDLYAVGAMLFEAVTGQQPFTSANLFGLLRAQLEDPVPSTCALRAEVPSAIDDVIRTALAKQPDERFRSAAAMSRALELASAALPETAWRALSTRGHAIRARAPSGNPDRPPSADPARAPSSEPVRELTPIAPSALVEPPQRPPPAPVPRAERSSSPRRKTMVAIGAIAAVVATGIGIGVVAHRVVASRDTAPIALDASAPVADAAPGTGETADAILASTGDPRPPSTTDARVPSDEATADAGTATVHIGPNVQIGSTVQIGGTNPREITVAASFEAARFDPVAFLPQATALARKLLPDAALSRFHVYGTLPAGIADLNLGAKLGSTEFMFRSPAASTPPPGMPRNAIDTLECRVAVLVTPTSVRALRVGAGYCDLPLAARPRCTLAQIWKRSIAEGVPDDITARVDYSGEWQLEDDKGTWHHFADDCR